MTMTDKLTERERWLVQSGFNGGWAARSSNMVAFDCARWLSLEDDDGRTVEQALAKDAPGGEQAEKYQELLYSVETKYPGETRHETALRYIRNAEHHDDGPAMSEGKPDD